MCRKNQVAFRKQKPGGKFDAQFQWRLERKEEKKQKTKNDQIINSIPTFLIPTYGYHSVCHKNFTAICKPKSKSKTSTRSTKISTQPENISIITVCNWSIHRNNLEKMKYVKLK